jgi:hypothetical protein
MNFKTWLKTLTDEEKKIHQYNLKTIYQTASTVFNMVDEEIDLYDQCLEFLRDYYG